MKSENFDESKGTVLLLPNLGSRRTVPRERVNDEVSD